MPEDVNISLTNFKNGTWQLINDVPTNKVAALRAAFPKGLATAGLAGIYYGYRNINEVLLTD